MRATKISATALPGDLRSNGPAPRRARAESQSTRSLLALAALIGGGILATSATPARADSGGAHSKTQYYIELPLYKATATTDMGESGLAYSVDSLPLEDIHMSMRFGKPIVYVAPFSGENKWFGVGYHPSERLEIGAEFNLAGIWGKNADPDKPVTYFGGLWGWLFTETGKWTLETGLFAGHAVEGGTSIGTNIIATQIFVYPITKSLKFFSRYDVAMWVNTYANDGESRGSTTFIASPIGMRMYWGAP